MVFLEIFSAFKLLAQLCSRIGKAEAVVPVSLLSAAKLPPEQLRVSTS